MRLHCPIVKCVGQRCLRSLFSGLDYARLKAENSYVTEYVLIKLPSIHMFNFILCCGCQVPAFEGKDGVKLFESNAIAYYVANEGLRGKTQTDAVLVQQWVEFADNEILPAALTWVFPCMGIMQYNKQVRDFKRDAKLHGSTIISIIPGCH
jgi:Glutathione S-transferase, N-terminal domain